MSNTTNAATFTGARAEQYATWQAASPAEFAKVMLSMTEADRTGYARWLSDPEAQTAHAARMAAEAEAADRRTRAAEAEALAMARTAELLGDDANANALDTLSAALASHGVVRQRNGGEVTKASLHTLATDGAYVTITRVPAAWVTDAQRRDIARDLQAQRADAERGMSHSVRD